MTDLLTPEQFFDILTKKDNTTINAIKDSFQKGLEFGKVLTDGLNNTKPKRTCSDDTYTNNKKNDLSNKNSSSLNDLTDITDINDINDINDTNDSDNEPDNFNISFISKKKHTVNDIKDVSLNTCEKNKYEKIWDAYEPFFKEDNNYNIEIDCFKTLFCNFSHYFDENKVKKYFEELKNSKIDNDDEEIEQKIIEFAVEELYNSIRKALKEDGYNGWLLLIISMELDNDIKKENIYDLLSLAKEDDNVTDNFINFKGTDILDDNLIKEAVKQSKLKNDYRLKLSTLHYIKRIGDLPGEYFGWINEKPKNKNCDCENYESCSEDN